MMQHPPIKIVLQLATTVPEIDPRWQDRRTRVVFRVVLPWLLTCQSDTIHLEAKRQKIELTAPVGR